MCAYIKQNHAKRYLKLIKLEKNLGFFITGLQYISENYTNTFNVWVTDEYHFYYLEMCMYASRTGQ